MQTISHTRVGNITPLILPKCVSEFLNIIPQSVPIVLCHTACTHIVIKIFCGKCVNAYSKIIQKDFLLIVNERSEYLDVSREEKNLSVHFSIYSFFYPSVCLSICLFIRVSVHPSIHPWSICTYMGNRLEEVDAH